MASNKSTIKYLNDLLDSNMVVKLHCINQTPFVMFEGDRYLNTVVSNILQDNELQVKEVKQIAYSLSQHQLMVDYTNDSDQMSFTMLDFPLGHNESTKLRAYQRVMELTRTHHFTHAA